MIAVDTNILVRFLTNDDKKQAELARKTMRDNEIWLSKTVLLETEWVLRYSYDFDPGQILGGFRALLGLSNLQIEDPSQITTALNQEVRPFCSRPVEKSVLKNTYLRNLARLL